MGRPSRIRNPIAFSPLVAGLSLALLAIAPARAQEEWSKTAQPAFLKPDRSWGPGYAKRDSRLVVDIRGNLYLSLGESLYLGGKRGTEWKAAPVAIGPGAGYYNALAVDAAGLVFWGPYVSPDSGRSWKAVHFAYEQRVWALETSTSKYPALVEILMRNSGTGPEHDSLVFLRHVSRGSLDSAASAFGITNENGAEPTIWIGTWGQGVFRSRLRPDPGRRVPREHRRECFGVAPCRPASNPNRRGRYGFPVRHFLNTGRFQDPP